MPSHYNKNEKPATSTRQDITKGGCPPGFKKVNGKCVQKGVGPEYKP